MNDKKFGALSSSTDPTQLANTVKGLVLAFSSVIILIAGAAGVPLAETQVVEAATIIGAVAGAVWTLYGLILKAIVFIGQFK